MSYSNDEVIKLRGISIQQTSLTTLLTEFDAKRLLLRVGEAGSLHAVEINAETAGGLDALRTEPLYRMIYEDLRGYKRLKGHGVVQIETTDEDYIVSHTITRGKTYPNTYVVGIRKPLFLGFLREAKFFKYFPVR